MLFKHMRLNKDKLVLKVPSRIFVFTLILVQLILYKVISTLMLKRKDSKLFFNNFEL